MNYAVDSVMEIVDWFLHTKPMTHKALQKLLYFSYGVYLVQNNESKDNINNALFVNNFEAWVHGPVDPEVYSLFKYNGINLLSKTDVIECNFSPEVLKALNTTMDRYGSYDADMLEEISHHHLPWQHAREGLSSIDASNNKLDDKEIFDTFYKILNG